MCATLHAISTSKFWIQSIPNEDHFPSKVAYLSHVSANEKIKENLNETKQKMFKTYCFEHFLSITTFI